ncbi:MAG: class I SAM-dependent methyltransferase, partial [archaeon GB-1867-035]|nr:class I SAM-dependent methyltransferase [Candidatus Culexmicrobium profundum]
MMVNDKAEIILKRIEEMARSKYLPIIGPKKGRILAELVRKFKPKRILEIGTLIGYSTIIMGKELDENAEIITIEIDKEEAKIAKENIKQAEIRPMVKVIIGDALEVIPKLEGKFDMVF